MARRVGRLASLGALVLLVLALASPVWATELELSTSSEQALRRIQDLWVQWISALDKQEYRRASTTLDQLETSLQDLGMRALADVALAADAYAIDSARRGQRDRADLALQAAARLDPGRPERAFARAKVDRLGGQWFAAMGSHLSGWWALLGLPRERALLGLGVLTWLAASLLLAGALFVAVQMLVKGQAVLRDVQRFLGRFLPHPLVLPVAVLVLLLPLLAPPPPVWLLLIWSLLLWGYGSVAERVVLTGLWLLVGFAPLLADWSMSVARTELSPPIRALESVKRDRLYGTLFADLGALSSLLPESPAVQHLQADLYRRLGQWDEARTVYGNVLAREPDNAPVLLNLGADAFFRGDHGSAIELFRRATQVAPERADTWFNLSQAYSAQYLFNESRTALQRANDLAQNDVSRWLQAGDRERLQTPASGLERGREIRAELAAQRAGAGGALSTAEAARRWLTPGLALIWIALAVSLHFARRPHGYSEPSIAELLSKSRARRLLRRLGPGFAATEAGDGAAAFFDLWIPVALLSLPWLWQLAWPLPLGISPGNGLLWALALLGLVFYALPRSLRLIEEVRWSPLEGRD